MFAWNGRYLQVLWLLSCFYQAGPFRDKGKLGQSLPEFFELAILAANQRACLSPLRPRQQTGRWAQNGLANLGLVNRAIFGKSAHSFEIPLVAFWARLGVMVANHQGLDMHAHQFQANLAMPESACQLGTFQLPEADLEPLLSGARLPAGARPFAHAYGGHQPRGKLSSLNILVKGAGLQPAKTRNDPQPADFAGPADLCAHTPAELLFSPSHWHETPKPLMLMCRAISWSQSILHPSMPGGFPFCFPLPKRLNKLPAEQMRGPVPKKAKGPPVAMPSPRGSGPGRASWATAAPCPWARSWALRRGRRSLGFPRSRLPWGLGGF